MATTTVRATGLTCNHCALSVTEEVSEVEGVDEVTVDVVKDGESTITIEHTDPISETAVNAAIAEAGFEVVTN
ncbi:MULTISPECIES: heavy-metal-associated domain-containing protein [unclassified Rothia (in: high G+C Gram-positive bacteria)]|uniref:heavy-metal-associated domain-containing protein n=1 Tax=unclassified Rothia (in: high G+C Gram-positive bacteria) TaxID=2689056 RepID=UPI001958DA32|nr:MULTISPECIES: heavy-metal-associated domain-containing protein [unclassified Rothia (in: high G+C Gram-positive bacteria)]MBM7051721.1 heavy-metal-associated domain-containing protein [Rothia sp. ZJ1223]QRZ61657.1 heavy-metal-associated domain-containing protein [Rothia sp. ZJ932]